MITTNSSGSALSAQYNTTVATTPRDWQVAIYLNGTQLSCGVKSMDITKGSCGNTESFAVGNVYTSMMTAELVDLTTDIKGEDLEVRVGLNTGSVEWITVGWFTAIEVVKTVYSTNVTAYGYTATKTAGSFVIPGTLTLANIATAIGTATGLTVSFGTGITTSYELAGTIDAGTSCYQGLQILAHACGGYCIDTHTGGIKIALFDDTATLSVGTDRMVNLPNVEESAFTITGVQVNATGQYTYSLTTDVAIDPDKTYYTYDSVNNVYVEVETPDVADIGTYYERFDVVYAYGSPIVLYDENANMSADVFNNIYKGLVGYSYYTGQIGLSMGDARIEGDDVLSVLDVDNNTYIVPCHIVTHHYDGGLYSNIQAVKATSDGDGIVSNAPITQQIDAISTATAIAKASAESAVQYAEQAQQSATTAYNLASQVQGLAQQAQQDANLAQQSATVAVQSANSALSSLSQVQSVLDVVNWVALHGEYEKTTDVAINPNKTYYTVTATAVATPTDDDIDTYYELVGTDYVKTTDTSVVVGKTYYTVVGTPVASPDVADIGTYYELSINEAMANYIQAHLALTNDGLYVMADNSDWKVLVASDGVYIVDPNNVVANQMRSTGNTVGYVDEMHLALDANGASIADGYGVDIFKVGTSGNSTARTIDTVIVPTGTTAVNAGDELTYTVRPAPNVNFVSYILQVVIVKNSQQYGMSYYLNAFPFTDNLPASVGTMTLEDNGDGSMTLTINASDNFTLRWINGQMSYTGETGTLSLGWNNTVTGDYSMALGADNQAVGDYCIVAGVGNSSSNFNNAFVCGKYNIYQGGAFEIGNGSDDTHRSNALTVDWSGNVTASGDMSCDDLTATGAIAGASATTTGNISAGGNVSCVDVTASGDVSCVDVTASGDVSATGGLSGATLTTTGNATVGGTITVQGHSSAIGDVKSATVSKAVNTADTWVDAPSLSLTAGVWLVSGRFQFASLSQTNARVLQADIMSGSTEVALVKYCMGTSYNAIIPVVAIVSLTATTTVKLRGQASRVTTTSGASNCYIQAVRIA